MGLLLEGKVEHASSGLLAAAYAADMNTRTIDDVLVLQEEQWKVVLCSWKEAEERARNVYDVEEEQRDRQRTLEEEQRRQQLEEYHRAQEEVRSRAEKDQRRAQEQEPRRTSVWEERTQHEEHRRTSVWEERTGHEEHKTSSVSEAQIGEEDHRRIQQEEQRQAQEDERKRLQEKASRQEEARRRQQEERDQLQERLRLRDEERKREEKGKRAEEEPLPIMRDSVFVADKPKPDKDNSWFPMFGKDVAPRQQGKKQDATLVALRAKWLDKCRGLEFQGPSSFVDTEFPPSFQSLGAAAERAPGVFWARAAELFQGSRATHVCCGCLRLPVSSLSLAFTLFHTLFHIIVHSHSRACALFRTQIRLQSSILSFEVPSPCWRLLSRAASEASGRRVNRFDTKRARETAQTVFVDQPWARITTKTYSQLDGCGCSLWPLSLEGPCNMQAKHLGTEEL